MVSDLKRAQARLIRQIARLEMKTSKSIGIHAVSKEILDILPQPR
jgi:hypothetical protein